jgi:hypothetical protein
LLKRINNNEMTAEDGQVIIKIINWFNANWWARQMLKLFNFFLIVDKLLGLNGKYKWLVGPLKYEPYLKK